MAFSMSCGLIEVPENVLAQKRREKVVCLNPLLQELSAVVRVLFSTNVVIMITNTIRNQ